MRLTLFIGFTPFLLLFSSGCQPAGRVESPAEKSADRPVVIPDRAELPPVNPDITWIDPRGRAPKNPVPILFIHADKSPAEWAKLNSFWTLTNGPAQAAAMIGLGPLAGPTVIAPDPQVVKIKVPRGLDDPTPFLPAANPPTLPKWELGRDLFYDPTWLTTNGNVSCASCHIPSHGFTDGIKEHDGFNTPTLINVVFNKRQFWDGRAAYLEEIVAQHPEDERETATRDAPMHPWPGVIGRLANSGKYSTKFEDVFGTAPTQDAVGKALATYLRTLLAADSIHDRAVLTMAQRSGKELEKDDYAAALRQLDPAALKTLTGESNRTAGELGAEMHAGYRLFNKLNCVKCHSGPLFTDAGFHNVGLMKEEDFRGRPQPGYFPYAPIGLKQRELIGAYKTPTLRGLLRTGPYFHNGMSETPEDALKLHTHDFRHNSYLDREFREEEVWHSAAKRVALSAEELKALTSFLKSLNGEDVDNALLPPVLRPRP